MMSLTIPFLWHNYYDTFWHILVTGNGFYTAVTRIAIKSYIIT